MGLIKETEHSYYSGNDFGGYQFISLKHIINNFMISYVGNDKIISKIKRTDVLFHAQRALQELSYDTLKSIKAQEIDVPPSLTMMLPQDYVNYVKLSWSDASGIEHVLYPASKTSNPTPILQNSDGEYALTAEATLTIGSATNVGTETSDGTTNMPFALDVAIPVTASNQVSISGAMDADMGEAQFSVTLVFA